MTLQDKLLGLFKNSPILTTTQIRTRLHCLNSADVVMRLRRKGHVIDMRMQDQAVYVYIRGPKQ